MYEDAICNKDIYVTCWFLHAVSLGSVRLGPIPIVQGRPRGRPRWGWKGEVGLELASPGPPRGGTWILASASPSCTKGQRREGDF